MRELQSGHLGITVSDQGIGIDRSQLKRIFKRFHRAPDPHVNERSGSGLGLYVVYRLVRNLGGRIRAESDGHRQGHDDAHPPAHGPIPARRAGPACEAPHVERLSDACAPPCWWWRTKRIWPRA